MGEIKITYKKEPLTGLKPEAQNLITKAKQALDFAHAPYSNFRVGCAVETTSGKIVSGNNQENAAYPSGLCAERVALFKLKSESREAIKSMAVVAFNSKGEPANAFCCGACRQVIMEYASLQEGIIELIMGTAEGDFITLPDARQLMPFSFDSANLS